MEKPSPASLELIKERAAEMEEIFGRPVDFALPSDGSVRVVLVPSDTQYDAIDSPKKDEYYYLQKAFEEKPLIEKARQPEIKQALSKATPTEQNTSNEARTLSMPWSRRKKNGNWRGPGKYSMGNNKLVPSMVRVRV